MKRWLVAQEAKKNLNKLLRRRFFGRIENHEASQPEGGAIPSQHSQTKSLFLKDPVKKTRRQRREREDVTVWATENGFEGMFEDQAGFNR